MPGVPLIFDVARGSCVDGPGIRTTIFLKGCPLRCLWCHNPEGQDVRQEIGVRPERCNGCGVCQERCPSGAIDLQAEGVIQRSRCTPCDACADACDSLAIQTIGVPHSVEELVEIALRDRLYFEVSGGGVTLSGGEPLLHLEFAAELVRRLKQEGIHVAVQTCGHFDLPRFEAEVLPWIDYIHYDVKHMDSATHARLTGQGNERILENLRRLVKEDRITVVPRVPLVPGLTATHSNLAETARLFRELDTRSYQLLTYNPSGAAKWVRLGKKPPSGLPVAPLTRDQELAIRAEFDSWLDAPDQPHLADR